MGFCTGESVVWEIQEGLDLIRDLGFVVRTVGEIILLLRLGEECAPFFSRDRFVFEEFMEFEDSVACGIIFKLGEKGKFNQV